LYTYWLAILSNPGLASPGIPCNEIGNPWVYRLYSLALNLISYWTKRTCCLH
jgi:hypothetical protein